MNSYTILPLLLILPMCARSGYDVHFETGESGTFERLHAGGKTENFTIPFGKETVKIEIPTKAADFTVTGKTESGRKFTWTVAGAAEGDKLKLSLGPGLVVARAAEIHVISEPKNATVEFNGKAYHDPTNFRSSQEPGKYTVTVKKDGYQPWTSEMNKELEKGEVWKIEAKLKKQ